MQPTVVVWSYPISCARPECGWSEQCRVFRVTGTPIPGANVIKTVARLQKIAEGRDGVDIYRTTCADRIIGRLLVAWYAWTLGLYDVAGEGRLIARHRFGSNWSWQMTRGHFSEELSLIAGGILAVYPAC
jgi:hypothetical protein